MTGATVVLPIKAVSVSNLREHWAKRAKRTKAHRMAAAAAWRPLRVWVTSASAVLVSLTRVAPRPLDGHDNLRASLKACVDGVADGLGLKNDADARVRWEYSQRRGKAREYAVEIAVFIGTLANE